MVDMARGEEAGKPAGSRRGEPGSGAVLYSFLLARNTNAFPLLCFLLLLLPHGVTVVVVVVVVFVCEQWAGNEEVRGRPDRTGRSVCAPGWLAARRP